MDPDEMANGLIPIFNVKTGRIENVPAVIKSEKEWQALLSPDQFEIETAAAAAEYRRKTGQPQWPVSRLTIVSVETHCMQNTTNTMSEIPANGVQ